MIHTDYHIHTEFSGDSLEPMEISIKQAIKNNLTDIAFTDHIETLSNSTNIIGGDFNDYIKHFNFLKNKYKNKISLKLGGEFTFLPNNHHIFNKIVHDYNFDFIIGSQHSTYGKSLYSDFDFTKYTKFDAYEMYLQDMLQSIPLNDFDVIGHIDFISRYSNYDDPTLYLDDHIDLFDAILKKIITLDKGLELNTSAIRYGCNNYYPAKNILTRYKQLGGKILTIGSDSHSHHSIGDGFDLVQQYVKHCGFNEIATFDKRVPSFYKI